MLSDEFEALYGKEEVTLAGDVESLARAMEHLYAHPQLREQFGLAARGRIRQYFRSEDTIRKTLELYREVMDE